MVQRRELIDVALGTAPADHVVRGGVLVNVLTGEIYPADVAIKGDRIAAVGDVAYTVGPDTTSTDAAGRFVVPGLVEGHLHCYHSYLGVDAFVQCLLQHGVTATADGFYGQGIVGGIEAVRFLKRVFERMPLRLVFLVPTMGYLQNRSLGLTPAPGLSTDDLFEMLGWNGCCGLEEPPSAEVVAHDAAILDLFDATLAQRKVVTGHAMGLSERRTQAYAAVGVTTDHESVEHHEGLMKARLGMKLLMREGSGALNVAELVRTYTEHDIDPRALAFCTDLASPEKLTTRGTQDECIRVAISHGVPPMAAIQMATINVAEIFALQHDIGCIAPGRYADLLLVRELPGFTIDAVMVGGRIQVSEGRFVGELEPIEFPTSFYGTVRLSEPVGHDELALRTDRPDGDVEVRVIGISDGSLGTVELRAALTARSGRIAGDVARDVLPLAMIDRFQKGGRRIGRGFVHGFQLRHGALATSANSVCENLVVVGTDPADMALAVNELARIGGGAIVVDGGEVVALVQMPLLGLQSDDPLEVVMDKFQRLFAALAERGCPLSNPLSQLEFCFASGEMGAIKLCDEGLLLIGAAVERVPVVVAPA